MLNHFTPGKLLTALTLGALITAGPAQATFISPVGVTLGANADIFQPNQPRFQATHLIDGLGNTNWVTTAATPDYIAQKGAPVLVFDLGTSFDFNRIAFGIYSAPQFNPNGNSATEFSIKASDNPTDFSGSDTMIAKITNTKDNLFDAKFRNVLQSVTLDSTLSGQYLQLTITDNAFGGPFPGGDRVGFSEIRIDNAIFTPGDTDGNQKVDINDYKAFKENYGTGTTLLQGDVDGDGDVDVDDFLIIRNEYPKYNNTTLAAAIPEPASIVVLGLGALAMLKRRK